jgi:putative ATP-dependent endonuclease of OLD family
MRINGVLIVGIRSIKKCKIKLSNYTALVGENNVGKSNIVDSINWFFGGQKFTADDIARGFEGVPYVQLSFNNLSAKESQDFKDYIENDEMVVTRELVAGETKAKYLFKLEKMAGKIKDAQFANTIWIPSLRPVSDELKLTAKSSFQQLSQQYLVARLTSENEKEKRFIKVQNAISELSEFMSDGPNGALIQMANTIQGEMLSFSKIGLGFELTPPSVDEFVKTSLKPYTQREGQEGKIGIESQGDGYQRSLTYALICCLAKARREEQGAPLDLYLVEEPELFLHPNHQTYFRDRLEELAKNSGVQVLITSHSPYFINNVKEFDQIKKVKLDQTSGTMIHEIGATEIQEICIENASLMVSSMKAVAGQTISKADEALEIERISTDDHLRYLLWIDPLRANAFLSKKVILVEGATEKAALQFLFNHEDGALFSDKGTADLAVIDTVGKFHIFKFSKLLKKFGVDAWVIFDGDNDKVAKSKVFKLSHKVLNDNIEAMVSSGMLRGSIKMAGAIEDNLGISKDLPPDIEIYKKLMANTDNCRQSAGYKRLVKFVKEVIAAH